MEQKPTMFYIAEQTFYKKGVLNVGFVIYLKDKSVFYIMEDRNGGYIYDIWWITVEKCVDL